MGGPRRGVVFYLRHGNLVVRPGSVRRRKRRKFRRRRQERCIDDELCVVLPGEGFPRRSGRGSVEAVRTVPLRIDRRGGRSVWLDRQILLPRNENVRPNEPRLHGPPPAGGDRPLLGRPVLLLSRVRTSARRVPPSTRLQSVRRRPVGLRGTFGVDKRPLFAQRLRAPRLGVDGKVAVEGRQSLLRGWSVLLLRIPAGPRHRIDLEPGRILDVGGTGTRGTPWDCRRQPRIPDGRPP
mmetsp:Transcript_29948/g.89073  ORF Transcript_29948/g.89073 Transcript_29948/m.89073 type:complete len:237 (+) Transcript_29948:499-1209(+)